MYGAYHIHGGYEIGDSSYGLLLPNRDGAPTADESMSCIMFVGAVARARILGPQPFPENAVVDNEHGGIDVDMVHAD